MRHTLIRKLVINGFQTVLLNYAMLLLIHHGVVIRKLLAYLKAKLKKPHGPLP
jgi:hypothetical protein